MQYQCILGIDFMKESKLTLDFDKKSLIIPDDQIKQLPKVEKPVEIDLSVTKFGEGQKQKLKDLFNSFKGLFSDQTGLSHVLYHEIDTGDQGPVVSRPYRYDKVKQGIIDYHIQKMLQEGKIRPIQSPYASPVVLTGKNNGLPPDSPEAYRFAIDYRKLNAITKYPRYPLPVIADLITNIPHTGIMSTLDLKSGYFQLAISPKDIEKTAFITRNGTFAFLRMPFGLSGVAPNFQKAIDMILKPVLGRFVMVYMDDVIITSPSFNEHIDHMNQVFTLLRDAGLTLNKDKCHFARDKLKYLDLKISKEGIETDIRAPISLISDNGPQFISEIFEHLSHRLYIKHIKTVTYQPQANLTERVNRTLEQMTACFVEENHDNWDRFLHEFSFALRTAVNESTGKTPAELFLDRKIITPFRKLINLMEGAEYAGGIIEKLFHESRQTMQKQHKAWENYYNRKRRKANIKVNDLVLGTAGLENLRFKRKVRSNGSVERYDRKRSKICRKRSYQGSKHRDRKRQTPVISQGINRTVPSSVTSKAHKYRRQEFNSSQGTESIAGSSHQQLIRQFHPPTEESRRGARVQYDKARETRASHSKIQSAAEGRPVRSRQTTAVRPCTYYLRSRLKEPDGIPEEQRSTGINSLPQNSLRRGRSSGV
ncbi:retrovirus-related Pol polyprotein from transposon 297 [Trichonephila clavipes]|nr:retrovirus-related Pol polyprotein from transposon 297 [Trichonephila clavipes]